MSLCRYVAVTVDPLHHPADVLSCFMSYELISEGKPESEYERGIMFTVSVSRSRLTKAELCVSYQRLAA